MFTIRPIRLDETNIAKRLIYTVAKEIFNDPLPLEESITFYESRHELYDMDDIESNYFKNGGVFLVMTNDDVIIGTGALRYLEEGICEIKRLWFLTEYHGKGLGYRMIMELFQTARKMGYKKVRLETDPVYQKRALEFYRRIGFYDIPRYSRNEGEAALEIAL